MIGTRWVRRRWRKRRPAAMVKRIVWIDQAKTDIRGIEQPIVLQVLKTLARYAQTGEGNTKQLGDIEPPMVRLRARNHRVFFRDKGDHLEISRVLDRKEATADGRSVVVSRATIIPLNNLGERESSSPNPRTALSLRVYDHPESMKWPASNA